MRNEEYLAREGSSECVTGVLQQERGNLLCGAFPSQLLLGLRTDKDLFPVGRPNRR